MSPTDETNDYALVEECIEELDELVTALDRYPLAAVAIAIATYLEGLLGALLDERQCTAHECASSCGRLRRVSSSRRIRPKSRLPATPAQ
jgi:hypothetical protein